ncbi:MAG: DUF3696 domain-containing protein [Lachnospiraceae bacterium]|nr:DUF3696 domain-containing protein [Lachnospiraceae bacterium]
MIRKLEVKNFKCFESLELNLKLLNVLMGLNGMGKSTVIQSLLLLRQSYQEKGLFGLKLNGKYVMLGNGSDVLSERAEDEQLRFYVEEDGGKLLAHYDYVPESDLLPNCQLEKEIFEDRSSALLGDGFQYLSAYRIEPRALYRIADEKELQKREFGNNGEFAIYYLNVYGSQKVENNCVIFNPKEDCSLGEQVRCWLSLISPGILPQISVNSALRNAELKYAFREGAERTNAYKSVNVGFGVTYVLPVIIALLTARPGELLLLENPEAHIHPAGQRWLGELIALSSAGGVQIIVETHSDHVINGIRLAVKKKKICSDETGIFFFYKDEQDSYRHKVITPVIDENGRIDIWPEGFLDEWDNALLELL